MWLKNVARRKPGKQRPKTATETEIPGKRWWRKTRSWLNISTQLKGSSTSVGIPKRTQAKQKVGKVLQHYPQGPPVLPYRRWETSTWPRRTVCNRQEGCLDAYTEHPQAQPRDNHGWNSARVSQSIHGFREKGQEEGIPGVFDYVDVITLANMSKKLDAHKIAQSGGTAVVTTEKMGLGSKRHEAKVKREFALNSNQDEQDKSRMDVDSDLDSDEDVDLDSD